MRTLVLGATGQLGSNLVRALLAKEDEVRALIRPSNKAITLRGVELEPRPHVLTCATQKALIHEVRGIRSRIYPEKSLLEQLLAS